MTAGEDYEIMYSATVDDIMNTIGMTFDAKDRSLQFLRPYVESMTSTGRVLCKQNLNRGDPLDQELFISCARQWAENNNWFKKH